jgi:hypothetical protein
MFIWRPSTQSYETLETLEARLESELINRSTAWLVLSLNPARIILLRSQLLISYLSPTFIPLYPLKRRKRCITQIPLYPQIYTNTNSSFLLHVPESLPNTHQPSKTWIPWVWRVNNSKASFHRPRACIVDVSWCQLSALRTEIKGYSCILLFGTYWGIEL